MDAKFTELVEQLNGLDFKGMYGSDFLHTWDKTTDELKALYIVADALRELRENNVSSKIFDSGLAVSLFRDNSTRTRFSFSKAANLLGLELQDLDEKKSQIAHGETVRETATMISFMADFIGIRDDMYIGKGDAYMAEVSESVQQAYEDGVLDHRPTLISLQSDSDHPTQSSADMLYLINEFGGLENLKGKKVAEGVRFLVVPASQTIYRQALKEGLMDVFMDAGAIVMNPNCSVCWGSCQGVIGENEVLISTGTRNFKGRAGHPSSKVYLGSAATVTASAIAGKIALASEV